MIPRRLAKKSLSAGVATLLLALSVAVPVMERGELVAETAVESAHDPARCGHAHDHRICTQVGANFSIAAVMHQHRAAHVVVRSASPTAPRSALLDTFLEGPPSRAPPLA